MNWHDLVLRVRAVMFRKRVERDLEVELDFHIEMQTRKNVAEGMSEAEARRRARIQFGGAAQVTEECRDVRGIGLIETVWGDVRYAIRGFRRSPIFVLTVVATIALGLGLDTAFFSIFNGIYFKPISVRDPYSLYEFFWTDRTGEYHQSTWPEYQQFLADNSEFSEALGYLPMQARVDGRNVLGTLVTGEYFRMLGVGAALGRTLLPEDSWTPGREPVVVVSYRAWQNRFAGDPKIIGKKIPLRGYPFEVVGVARAGFTGLGGRPSEFWAPMSMAGRLAGGPDLFGLEHPRSLSIVGRLRAGFSVRQAQAGLTVWAQRLTASSADREKATHAILLSRATIKPTSLKNILLFSPILVAFSLVLLIGCANVANMMLARAMSRQREIGIRLSLGAARGRLIRQLLTESTLLALPAAAAGLAASQAIIGICLRVLLATLPPGSSDVAANIVTRLSWLSSDFRVYGFTFAAAIVSAVLFGLAPAIQATRTNVMQAAKGDFTSGLRPWRLSNSLVVGQFTVCVLLLITAGILLRGVNRVHSLNTGLSTRDVIEVAVEEKSRTRILDRLRSEPVVEVVAAGANAPVDRKPTVLVRTAEGAAILRAAANNVSSEYFAVFEIPLVRGRDFSMDEAHSGAPDVVVSQTAAERLWPNQEAVGRSLHLVPDGGTGAGLRRYQVVTVIGVARDEISRWITNGEDKAQVYFPTEPQAPGNELFVGVHGDQETARRALDAALTAIDPAAVNEIQKIQVAEWVAEEAYSFRVAYWVALAIGVLALLLTLSGIYGVLAFVVSQRRKEIGIRMAMGATSGAVTVLVLKQSMRLAGMGAALGGVLALGASRILASVLVMINTFDVAAYFGVVLLVLAACAAAAYFPSRRASRIDPLTTLRYD